MIGQKFGRWTVISHHKDKSWLCECSCEKKTQKFVYECWLRGNKSKSCGCTKKPSQNEYFEQTRQRILANIKHQGECWIWTGMKAHFGYGKIAFVMNGKRTHLTSHRVSYMVFNNTYLQPNEFVLHSCHIPACVNPSHLRKGSTQENTKDMMEANRQSKGESSGTSKLTEEQIKMIRKRKDSSTQVAKDFNIHKSTVCRIRKRTTWNHI